MNAPLFPADIGNVSVLRETPVAYDSSAIKDGYTEGSVPKSYATGSNVPESNADFYQSNVKGRHALDDYYRLPSERRVELIDGTFLVQPDLLVVCNRDKISRFGIYGAPDF